MACGKHRWKNSRVIGGQIHQLTTLRFWRRSRCENQIWAIYHVYHLSREKYQQNYRLQKVILFLLKSMTLVKFSHRPLDALKGGIFIKNWSSSKNRQKKKLRPGIWPKTSNASFNTYSRVRTVWRRISRPNWSACNLASFLQSTTRKKSKRKVKKWRLICSSCVNRRPTTVWRCRRLKVEERRVSALQPNSVTW